MGLLLLAHPRRRFVAVVPRPVGVVPRCVATIRPSDATFPRCAAAFRWRGGVVRRAVQPWPMKNRARRSAHRTRLLSMKLQSRGGPAYELDELELLSEPLEELLLEPLPDEELLEPPPPWPGLVTFLRIFSTCLPSGVSLPIAPATMAMASLKTL